MSKNRGLDRFNAFTLCPLHLCGKLLLSLGLFFTTEAQSTQRGILKGRITFFLSGRFQMAEKPYIGKWISCIYRIGQSFFDQYFDEYGIGLGHYSCLLCLFRGDGITQDAISKFTHTDKATTTRSITKLLALGYVTRHVNLNDRRAYKVYLTEKGRQIEPEVRQILRKWADLITNGFTPAETEKAYVLVERMALNAINLKTSMNHKGK